MSKQQNLSTFFSSKPEQPIKLRQGWQGNDNSRGSEYGASIEQSNEQSRKRVLPSSMNNGTNRDSTSTYAAAATKPFKSSYPSSAAYGAPKNPASIGGVPFVSPAGILAVIERSFY